ncbi:MAG: SPOR domain-containing protein [candidate division Zixibacteria bacterium]|nr:SPOR domain-containing protein [candidate division Zixibacteria bacterium]
MILLLTSCSARQGGREKRAPAYDPSVEEFDPFAYPGDSEIVTAAAPAEQEPPTEDSTLYFIETGTPSPYPSQVFRIQLFASQYYSEALEEKDMAAEVFNEAVRISYVVPYYRVEIGNFRSSDDADRFLGRARALGYQQSWIVEEEVDSLFWINLEINYVTFDSLFADSLAVDSLSGSEDDR